MKVDVNSAIDELRHQFRGATVTATEDGEGGAKVVIEPVAIGNRYRPESTWLGFHIPAQYPYADIYPVFIGGDVVRKDGTMFSAPITSGHNFEGRVALQISRRNAAAEIGSQKVINKLLKVLDFLKKSQ